MSISVAEHTEALSPSQSERLRALPARYYIDEQVLAEEREKLFFRTWQYACHVSELEKPGAYVTAEVLGQQVFVVRAQDGTIKAFYNVCPHRGHKLLEGAGEKRAIVCPYHQWTFSLDGSLRSLRVKSSSEAPAKDSVCLTSVRVDRLLDFVFINLDPDAEPITEFWPGVEEHILKLCPEVTSYKLSTSATVIHQVDLAANWKVSNRQLSGMSALPARAFVVRRHARHHQSVPHAE